MGKRGPVPASNKKAKNKAQDVTTSAVITPSSHLSALAKKYWRSLIASFPAGHFTESDRVLLEQFCIAAAVHQTATRFLDKPGADRKSSRYCTDRYGKTTLHPAVKDQHQAACDCSMLATKLRITKAAMISPKAVGRAAQNAAEAQSVKDAFGDLLFDAVQ